jgi:leucyl aminopeptidase
VELLPAQGNATIEHIYHSPGESLSEKVIRSHDAVIVLIDAETALATLKTLPAAALWQKLFSEAAAHGPVGSLHSHITVDSVSTAIVFCKAKISAFERLTQAARAWKSVSATSPRRLLIATAGLDAARADAAVEAVVAAALAGSARMPVIKSKPVHAPTLAAISVYSDGASDSSGRTAHWGRTVAIDHGNHLARWLSCLPPNILNSGNYRRAIGTLAKANGWNLAFFDERSLQKLGAGAFLAVSRANDHRDAGIIRLRYKARNRRTVRGHLALIGKGICFDTGGINLKPNKSMYLMHEDMQGSAVALGTLLALTELEAPYDIDCWLAITENETGARAYRPQEVVTAANGVTIQVAHSDAEGRMVLADTLALAAREKPELMLDFATLTGSCVTALTERYSGAFSNRPEWRSQIEAAGTLSGERVWAFPMDDDFDADLDSPIADVLQCTPDSKGDHILAARFLNRFVPRETPWIHIDLASSNRAGGLAHIPTDFTGFGVRYAVQLLLDGGLIESKPAKGPSAPTGLASRRKITTK